MPVVEYPAGGVFPGVIGRTADESSPAWPAPVRSPKGTPNVVFIVLDDTGFGHLGCYGSPIETPNLDALAAEGVLFKRHYANAVPCGPSRASLHTGMYLQNHRSGTNGTPLDARHTNWALESAKLDDTFTFREKTTSVRWMWQHLVEEYARHNGHADLIREAIDGSAGM